MGLLGVLGLYAGRRSICSPRVSPTSSVGITGFSAALDSVPSEKGDDWVVVCLPTAGVAFGSPLWSFDRRIT